MKRQSIPAMRTPLVIVLLSLAIALLLAADGQAAPATSTTLPWPDLGKAAARSPGGGVKDAALLVAIERYTYLDDKPVTGAKRNLKDWQLYLTQTRGVPVENVTLLRDDQATREKILNAAADTAKHAQPGGTVWFLFIGHGAPATGKKTGGVLLGVDTQNDADSLTARGVLQSELLAVLGKGNHTRTVAILDSCFSGRSNTGSTLVAGLQPIVATRIDAVVTTGAIVLAAAQGNEYAGPLPGGNRPAFSYLTLAALRGWGDSNHDGKVSVSEATQYARRALQALLVGRHQTPDIAGPGDRVMVASAGEAGPDLAEWQRTIDGATDAPSDPLPEPAKAALPTSRQTPTKKLVVLEFSGGDLKSEILDSLSDAARTGAFEALNGSNVTVITRENLAVLMRDERSEGDCEIETAQNVGADYVISGRLARVEDSHILVLKLHDTKHGLLLGTRSISARGPAAMVSELAGQTRSLVAATIMSGPRPAP